MQDRPPVVALRASLAALVVQLDSSGEFHGSNRELEARVHAVVDDLRSIGWPPERVVVAVKAMADDAGLNVSRRLMRASDALTGRDAAIAQLVRWCIERYYCDAAGKRE